MNELALIKVQSIILGLDRELKGYVDELISGQGLLSDDN